MNEIINNVDLLGFNAEDKVTGFKGVITTMSFDLYGCIQAAITPKVDKGGNILDGRWFDITRLKIGKRCAMEVPNFSKGYIAEGRKGAAEKPAL